jgi:hypothetical protein
MEQDAIRAGKNCNARGADNIAVAATRMRAKRGVPVINAL